jgi:spoIIIJ-associated protein
VKAVLDIEGDDLGILIGRRGSTMAALQYLLNLMVTRKFKQHAPFAIDVDGYRQRREESLRELAFRMAERVRATGRSVTLEPMPPNERRIVHLALAKDPTVGTSSVGEGDSRKVAISIRR